MSEVAEIRRLLAGCSAEQKKEIFDELRNIIPLHPFEQRINAQAEVILEALGRAPDLTILGIRGIIGEATFAIEVVRELELWQDVTPPGNHSYDAVLRDAEGAVKVQVKMQRREKGLPLIKDGQAVVEVQRTRGGKDKEGAATRPYRFGTFDILAVCMEPSHGRWNSFLYIPERWLFPRPEPDLIKIMQPVPFEPNDIYTDDFNEAAARLRGGAARPDIELCAGSFLKQLKK